MQEEHMESRAAQAPQPQASTQGQETGFHETHGAGPEKAHAGFRSKAILAPEDMESRPKVRRAVLALAWPVIIEQVLSMLTHMVDSAMIGRLGAEVVAGVSLSFQPMMLVNGIFGGIAMGNTVLVARSVGAGDKDTASRAAFQALVLAGMLGLLLVVPAWIFAPKVISLMGADAKALSSGIRYFRWLIPGAPFMLCSFIMGGSLRGAGDTRTPMIINAAANLLNVFLNWVFIWGNLGAPRLEEAGAALATSIARFFAFAAMFYVANRPKSIIHFKWPGLRAALKLDFPLIRRIISIGFPAALERLFMSSASLIYARTVASLGMVPYAAHVVSLNAESMSYMPAFGFSTAASTMVGQNLGAKQPKAAKVSAIECWKMAAAVMGGMAVLFLLFPVGFMKIFTDDSRVYPYAYLTMRIMAYIQIPESVGFVMGGALRGAGDTRTVLGITMAGAWGVRVGLALLLIRQLGMGLEGAWIAMAADWTLRATFMVLRWRSDKWQEIRV
ncbi:MAG TPA: MATE family efflux transporter [Bacillota bacterium]|jgi:putative MATE family efflux protein|nr:MATE family efflux transporter [Bacillota bacterium]HQD85931.1 MATE family efflux transporter [Bacillota bacterium]